MTITFLAISFLMGLFVSATRNNNRAKTLSTAGFLAQSKMEVLHATPLDQIVTGTDNFTGQYASYVYDVEVQDAGDYDGDGTPDPDMKMITLKVTAPDNKGVASLFSLRSAGEPFLGVACHATDKKLAFMGSADSGDAYVHGWKFPNELDPNALFPFTTGAIKLMPNGGRGGDVAADPNLNSMWAVDSVNNCLRYYDKTMADWSPTAFRPAGLGWATGVAVNTAGDTVWLSDESNKCLWTYTNAPHLAGIWSTALRPPPPDTLGRIRDISVNDAGTEVWMADFDNNCVRHYTWNGAGGNWDPVRYKNPDNSLDGVVGVAVTRDGSRLYVMDEFTLQWCDPSNPAVWTKIDLDSKLSEDIPHGLAVSDDGRWVWAIAKNGLLFRCDTTDPANPQWWELGP